MIRNINSKIDHISYCIFNIICNHLRSVAVTQLRPNNARRMFPCFDEPGYKTPFEISVVRPRDMLALSNMPIARSMNM